MEPKQMPQSYPMLKWTKCSVVFVYIRGVLFPWVPIRWLSLMALPEHTKGLLSMVLTEDNIDDKGDATSQKGPLRDGHTRVL